MKRGGWTPLKVKIPQPGENFVDLREIDEKDPMMKRALEMKNNYRNIADLIFNYDPDYGLPEDEPACPFPGIYMSVPKIGLQWYRFNAEPFNYEFYHMRYRWTVRCEDFRIIKKFNVYSQNNAAFIKFLIFTVPDWHGNRIGWRVIHFDRSRGITFMQAFLIALGTLNDRDSDGDYPDSVWGDRIREFWI